MQKESPYIPFRWIALISINLQRLTLETMPPGRFMIQPRWLSTQSWIKQNSPPLWLQGITSLPITAGLCIILDKIWVFGGIQKGSVLEDLVNGRSPSKIYQVLPSLKDIIFKVLG